MSDPGFTRPDLCSIRAVAGQAEPAGAARGGHSAGGRAPTVSRDDSPAHWASGIDRAIRLSTAAAVLAVAGIAAYVSYWHAYAVVRAHGETGITARLEPATIDGLVYASSMVVLYAARHRVPVPSLARWLLGLGIAATLTANMAQGWSHGPVGAVVAAWPRSASWARTNSWSGSSAPPGCRTRAVGRAPWQRCGLPCRGGSCPGRGRRQRAATAGASASAPGQARQPADRVAGQPAIPAGGQRDDAVPEAGAVNDAAVAAYRLSVQAGNPLSERKLAQTVRTHIPPLGASQDHRRPASIAAPGLAGHPGHGLTARPGGISASGPAGITRRFTQVPDLRQVCP